MPAPAAFSGDYVDLRFVKSRKVAQIVIELPIEQSAAFVAAFGTPNPSTCVPVALARLSKEPEPAARKDKRRFSELQPSQQAAMRCNEVSFQQFLGAQDMEDAARIVRARCNVSSRSHLNADENAAESWRLLDNEYFGWQRGLA